MTRARAEYAAAIEITPQLVGRVIEALRAAAVLYVVAPCEADAQLACLCQNGMVDAVLSEDGDMLASVCLVVGGEILGVFVPFVCAHMKHPPQLLTKYSSDSDVMEGVVLDCVWDWHFGGTCALCICASRCNCLEHIPRLGPRGALELVTEYPSFTRVRRVCSIHSFAATNTCH